MENPKQAVYTVGELFALRPEPVMLPAPPEAILSTHSNSLVAEAHPNLSKSWTKNILYTLVGVIAVCGIYFYFKQKKTKDHQQESSSENESLTTTV